MPMLHPRTRLLSVTGLLMAGLLAACPAPEDELDTTPSPTVPPETDTPTPAPTPQVTPTETPLPPTPTIDPDEPTPVELRCEASELTACTAKAGTNGLILLKGTLVHQDSLDCDGEVLFSPTSGQIMCAGDDCSSESGAAEATVLCTEGVISAGLINPHDHAQYNSLPPWQHEDLFESRYQWQTDDGYREFSEAYNAVKSKSCMVTRWAEARLLIGGATSVLGTSAGSDGDSCLSPLIRDLDADATASFIDDLDIKYYSGKIGNVGDEDEIIADLESGQLSGYVPHIAEGINGTVRSEFETLEAKGLLRDDVSIIHGTDLVTDQFARQAMAGTGLIVSPQSNLDLYGRMTDLPLADQLGVNVAVSTDWTPSGSINVTTELQCLSHVNESYFGRHFKDRELLAMSTVNAARAAHVSTYLGKLEAGYLADITVFSVDRTEPVQAIIGARPKDIQLVFVDGQAIYGDTSRMKTEKLEASAFCEDLDVCGTGKRICMQMTSSQESAEDIESTLQGILDSAASAASPEYLYAYELYPLFACEEPAPIHCDVSTGLEANDRDKDGVEDSLDNCRRVYNPEQRDTDGDGTGDSCDACPLTPAETCNAVLDPLDPDEDQVSEKDNCPFVHNPDQADTDQDGIGDVCEAEFTIPEIRSPYSTNPPTLGDKVTIHHAVVTALKPSNAASGAVGFYIQDMEATEYAGMFVYLGAGDIPVAVGDEVVLTGSYTVYNGQAELDNPQSIQVLGQVPLPDYLEIADPLTIATGGEDALAVQAMRVKLGEVVVIDANPDAPSDYDEFEVGPAEAVTGLRVDDYFYAELDQPDLGTAYSELKGILIFTFNNSKLAPETSEDMVVKP